ncbi:beta-glucoside-specific PTS transporter subunit IIABC [Paenibacillus sp. USHLN196]|uniref:beta-glucoside-specific PTS transporter subunit IIABC n=1 Tax=Paenibacillus sp. USHLN196 TaxID=3081291 RepID=UPI00301A2DFE
MQDKELAKSILQKVGGEENISNLTHCATRIRMNLKDDSKADLESISKLQGVLKAQNQSGQTQIVIGARVKSVHDELSNMVNVPSSNDQESKKSKLGFKGSVNAVIETIAGVFSPILPVLVACGLTKAATSIMVNFNWLENESNIVIFLNMIGDLVFYFLPFFLAVSAAKKFKTNEYIALALAGAYMYPTIMDGAKAISETGIKSLDLFTLPVLFVNYKSSVIPIILSVWVMSYIHRKVDKIMPHFLKIFFTSMVVILVMVPLQLIVLGPLGTYIGEGLAEFIQWFYETGGVFSAILLGATRSLLTMLGMHYALAPLQIQEIAQTGSSYILVSALTANMAQAGAALGVFFAIKNKSAKSLAASTSFPAFLGITEPAMYGVNLKYKRPFFIALGASAVSSAFLYFFNAKSTAYAPPGLFTLPIFEADSFVYIIIGVIISATLACVGTYFFGIAKKDNIVENIEKKEETTITEKATIPSSKVSIPVESPIKGEIIPLNEVPDAAFAEEAMGKGIAIQPTEGKVFAPFDGTVETVFRTKHVIALKSNDGVELLIHIGVDTVKLQGQHFNVLVHEGQKVTAGELIAEFDIEAIRKAGFPTITPVIITNTMEFLDVLPTRNSGTVSQGEHILSIIL